jgi:L-fucose mutarotase
MSATFDHDEEGHDVLRHTLLHPELIGALAAAGHGSQILLADGNYPHSTGVHPSATRVHLNLSPGVVTVDQVLEAVLATVPVEAATVMVPDTGEDIPAHGGYRRAVSSATWHEVDRFAFYDLARGHDLAVVVATADERVYANLLLTIGVRASST